MAESKAAPAPGNPRSLSTGGRPSALKVTCRVRNSSDHVPRSSRNSPGPQRCEASNRRGHGWWQVNHAVLPLNSGGCGECRGKESCGNRWYFGNSCRNWNLQELHLRYLAGSTSRISELSGENPACKCRLHRFHLKLLLFFKYRSPLPTSYQVARSGGSVASTLAGKRPKTQTKSPFLKDISALSTKSAAESAKRNCSKFTVGRPSLTP